MQISQEMNDLYCPESEVIPTVLDLNDKRILELGCGNAMLTREIAQAAPDSHIDALEVDSIQHHKNCEISDLPNVTFILAGAQAIPAEDETYDIVFMFKSLHHVPMELLDQALQEIRRVLKPGGIAYLSEPVYAGDFNDMVRLFHDEKLVREAAFAAIQKAVQQASFRLKDELFFNTRIVFENFTDFENKVLKATHTEHRLDEATYTQVQEQFTRNMSNTGACFTAPMRVDLLQKP